MLPALQPPLLPLHQHQRPCLLPLLLPIPLQLHQALLVLLPLAQQAPAAPACCLSGPVAPPLTPC